MKGYFITGTDTDIGKTYVSGVLVRSLLGKKKKVAYFKPVQSGTPSDTDYVSRYLPAEHIYSIWSFDMAEPPHRLAKLTKIKLSLNEITEQYQLIKKLGYDYIIVEGAGGAATPLNDKDMMADIALGLKVPAIVVARGGLGVINHSVITHDYLINKGVKVKGFIVNNADKTDIATVRANADDIEHYTKSRILAIIDYDQTLTDVVL